MALAGGPLAGRADTTAPISSVHSRAAFVLAVFFMPIPPVSLLMSAACDATEIPGYIVQVCGVPRTALRNMLPAACRSMNSGKSLDIERDSSLTHGFRQL